MPSFSSSWFFCSSVFKSSVSFISFGLSFRMADKNPIRAFSSVMISLKAKSILGFIKKSFIICTKPRAKMRVFSPEAQTQRVKDMCLHFTLFSIYYSELCNRCKPACKKFFYDLRSDLFRGILIR